MCRLLSLCVPTYNRAALLAQALRAILSQVDQALASKVEVVVVDNASPDNTPQIVEEAQAAFPHVSLRSVRHAENIGPDANYCQAMKLARGEFVYLLSDDDVLLPGAVAKLLSLIEEHPGFDAFCLNVRQFTGSPQEEKMRPPALKLEADRLIRGRDEALLFLQTHITFMSAMAFRRQNTSGKDYSDKYVTNLAQAYMFLDALAPGRGLYAVRETFLAQRADNNEGFDFFRVFVTNYHALLQYARGQGYAPETIRRILEQHLHFVNHYVLVFKREDTFRKMQPGYFAYVRAAGKLLRLYGPNRYLLFVILPRMLVPRFLYLRLWHLRQALRPRSGV